MTIVFDKINDILLKNLPDNNSGGEVVLSVGESLLFVMNVCEKEKVDKDILTQLKRLYLEGTKTDEEKNFVLRIGEILLRKSFIVKSDAKTISEDPVRRYFETNLAYHILQKNFDFIETSKLSRFTDNLRKQLFSLSNVDLNQRRKIKKILKGILDEKVLNKYELEYAELIHKLLNQDYYGLSAKACKNFYQITCNTILATLTTQFDESLPVDVYSDGIFTMGMDGRGRIIKASQDKVRTTTKGLMKSISPIPFYNDLVNPVEQSYSKEEFSPFQRSADQADFMIESQWCQYLFSRQTQLYSNGISSTTLAQIRNIILQQRLGKNPFDDSFLKYMMLFAALMIYNSGGHSFFEIFEVFKLPLSQELLSSDSEFLESVHRDDLMDKLLRRDQEELFDSVLQSTQNYARTLLNKKLLHVQIRKKGGSDARLVSMPQTARINGIHDIILNESAQKLEELLGASSDCVDALNYKKWSPLMVTAQLGKTDHIEKLLSAGANIKQQVRGLSSLELAIKSEQFETVQILLKAGALVKRKNGGSIKKQSPALYLACRQQDMRILECVLISGKFDVEEKKAAILIAIKIENLGAVKVLLKYIAADNKQKQFSEKYKSDLLIGAVALGNIGLIKEIMTLVIHSSTHIDYAELLKTAAGRGFLPTAKYLLDLAESKVPQSPIDIDSALKEALMHNHYDMAVLLIIYGANPETIPIGGSYLRSLDSYLHRAQCFDVSFNEREIDKIHARAGIIQALLDKRKNNPLHSFLTSLIEFMNLILPDSWRLGYKEKTNVMESISRLFQSKDPMNDHQAHSTNQIENMTKNGAGERDGHDCPKVQLLNSSHLN